MSDLFSEYSPSPAAASSAHYSSPSSMYSSQMGGYSECLGSDDGPSVPVSSSPAPSVDGDCSPSSSQASSESSARSHNWLQEAMTNDDDFLVDKGTQASPMDLSGTGLSALFGSDMIEHNPEDRDGVSDDGSFEDTDMESEEGEERTGSDRSQSAFDAASDYGDSKLSEAFQLEQGTDCDDPESTPRVGPAPLPITSNPYPPQTSFNSQGSNNVQDPDFEALLDTLLAMPHMSSPVPLLSAPSRATGCIDGTSFPLADQWDMPGDHNSRYVDPAQSLLLDNDNDNDNTLSSTQRVDNDDENLDSAPDPEALAFLRPVDQSLPELIIGRTKTELTIGRNSSNDFKIADARVSLRQCRLQITQDGMINLFNNSSSNGTWVKRGSGRWRKVRDRHYWPLLDGDTIAFGDKRQPTSRSSDLRYIFYHS